MTGCLSLIEVLVAGNSINIETPAGNDFTLYKFNGAFTYFILTSIRFAIDHDPGKTIVMYCEQVD